jgi:hypothetical protein
VNAKIEKIINYISSNFPEENNKVYDYHYDYDISRNFSNNDNYVKNIIERYKREIENKSENEVLFKYNPQKNIDISKN